MLPLILAPDPIYKTLCREVAVVDDAIRTKLAAMMETVEAYEALGIGGPMVGITERLVVISLEDESGKLHRYHMVNPSITMRSEETITSEEASITFLGISAPVTRAKEVRVTYRDENGAAQQIDADGILAICLQHEMDYLDGKTILDHQPPMKRDMLKRKMEKQKRLGPHPHVHGPHCNHG